jgi:hypothetical protein
MIFLFHSSTFTESVIFQKQYYVSVFLERKQLWLIRTFFSCQDVAKIRILEKEGQEKFGNIFIWNG